MTKPILNCSYSSEYKNGRTSMFINFFQQQKQKQKFRNKQNMSSITEISEQKTCTE